MKEICVRENKRDMKEMGVRENKRDMEETCVRENKRDMKETCVRGNKRHDVFMKSEETHIPANEKDSYSCMMMTIAFNTINMCS